MTISKFREDEDLINVRNEVDRFGFSHFLANKMQILCKNKEHFQVLTKNAYSLMHEYWNFNLYSKQLNLALSQILEQKQIDNFRK